jgi:hypothetical protein
MLAVEIERMIEDARRVPPGQAMTAQGVMGVIAALGRLRQFISLDQIAGLITSITAAITALGAVAEPVNSVDGIRKRLEILDGLAATLSAMTPNAIDDQFAKILHHAATHPELLAMLLSLVGLKGNNAPATGSATSGGFGFGT